MNPTQVKEELVHNFVRSKSWQQSPKEGLVIHFPLKKCLSASFYCYVDVFCSQWKKWQNSCPFNYCV